MTTMTKLTTRTLLAVLATLVFAYPTFATTLTFGPATAGGAPWLSRPSGWRVQPPDRSDGRQDNADSDRESEVDEDREDDLYDDAYDALDDSEWAEATELFDSVIAMAGARVDAAMYWSAYARNRQGLGG